MALGAAINPRKQRRTTNGTIVVDDTSPQVPLLQPRAAWQPVAAVIVSGPNEDPFEKPDPEEVPNGARLLSYDISGFNMLTVNGAYSPDTSKVIGRRRMFWHPQRKFFMYYCMARRRWQISPHFQSSGPGRGSIDLLDAVLKGGDHCIARQVSETSWQEFIDGSWQPRRLEVEHVMCVPATEDQSAKLQQPSLHPVQHPTTAGEVVVAASRSVLNGQRPVLPVEHARRCRPIILAPISASEAGDGDSEMYRRVWVGWFPETVTSQHVLRFLEAPAKDVEKVHHTVGRWSEALIHFKTQGAAALAVKYDGKFLAGVKVQVGYYQSPEEPEAPETEPDAVGNSVEQLEPEDASPQASADALQEPSACDMMHFTDAGGEVRPVDPSAGDDFWGETSPSAPAVGSSAPGVIPEAELAPAKELRPESSAAAFVAPRESALKKGRPRKSRRTSPLTS